MNRIYTILFSTLLVAGSFINASEVGRYTGPSAQGNGSTLVNIAGNVAHYGAKGVVGAVKLATPVFATGLKIAEKVTENPYALGFTALSAAYLGWRQWRWNKFDAVSGNARYFAPRHELGTAFNASNQQDLYDAIQAVTPYAPDARRINAAFAHGSNDKAKKDVRNSYVPRTRTTTDLFRYLRGRWPYERRTLAQVVSPLIYVNGKEANELLVQLKEAYSKIDSATHIVVHHQ